MITFTLFSEENPKGLVLAKVLDKCTAYVLTKHYKEIYNKPHFKLEIKESRKPSQWLCGWYGVQDVRID